MRLPILMYHAVGPDRPGFDPWLTISPRLFEKHLRWLKKHHYTSIHIRDWIAYQAHGIEIPEKPVVLTFDDAYADTAEYAIPLLQKYGFSGTIFVVTDEIGGSNRWDWRLGLSDQKLITSRQIRSLSANEFEIGSHTMSHPDLRSLDPDRLECELERSKQRLTDLTSRDVASIAYPYGYHDARIQDAARKYFSAGLTCDKGLSDINTDPFTLKRVTVVPRCTWGDMILYTKFGCNPILQARIFVQRLLRKRCRFPQGSGPSPDNGPVTP